jgi:hypothetical protein
MKPKHLYLALCVPGAALPYSQFIPFLRENGPNLRLMWEELFANWIGGFFGMDVIVSALVLFVFVAIDGRRNKVSHRWAAVAATLTVGVSLGLPLFLYLRELSMTRRATPGQ